MKCGCCPFLGVYNSLQVPNVPQYFLKVLEIRSAQVNCFCLHNPRNVVAGDIQAPRARKGCLTLEWFSFATPHRRSAASVASGTAPASKRPQSTTMASPAKYETSAIAQLAAARNRPSANDEWVLTVRWNLLGSMYRVLFLYTFSPIA
jgi:hypothetical protein